MQGLRMVPVTRVSDGFHARVLAARLGSEGILTQLRGGIDSPYPIGAVEVLVDEADLVVARELLLVDEVEDALGTDGEAVTTEGAAGRGWRRLAPWVAGGFASLLVVTDLIAVLRRR